MFRYDFTYSGSLDFHIIFSIILSVSAKQVGVLINSAVNLEFNLRSIDILKINLPFYEYRMSFHFPPNILFLTMFCNFSVQVLYFLCSVGL